MSEAPKSYKSPGEAMEGAWRMPWPRKPLGKATKSGKGGKAVGKMNTAFRKKKG